MTNLISGKEALIALANGERIEVRMAVSDRNPWKENMGTYTVEEVLAQETAETDDYCSMLLEFRLKPRTITLNGIEVPAPFEPKEGEKFWHLYPPMERGYNFTTSINSDYYQQFGAWRTEDEIKQVVEALRQVFGIRQILTEDKFI